MNVVSSFTTSTFQQRQQFLKIFSIVLDQEQRLRFRESDRTNA